MAVTNEALSEQIEATELRSAQRSQTLHEKLDDFIDVQRTCNARYELRLQTLESGQDRLDERVSQLRNVFGGIQLMFGSLLAWIGLS